MSSGLYDRPDIAISADDARRVRAAWTELAGSSHPQVQALAEKCMSVLTQGGAREDGDVEGNALVRKAEQLRKADPSLSQMDALERAGRDRETVIGSGYRSAQPAASPETSAGHLGYDPDSTPTPAELAAALKRMS